MESMECDVCCHHYDEDERQPRTLSCGHTLCTVCVKNGISASQLKCPFCRRVYSINTFKDIPVSFTLLRVMRTLAAMGNEPFPTVQPHRVASEPEMHAGSCAEHGAYKLFRCSKCQVWICRECTVIEHPTGTCTVVSVKQALGKMKEEENDLVLNSETSANTQVTDVNTYLTKLTENDKGHDRLIKEFQKLIDKQTEAKLQLKRENNRFSDCLKNGAEALQKMTAANKKLQENRTVDGITGTCQESQLRRKDLELWIKETKDDITNADVLEESKKLQKDMQQALNTVGFLSDPPYAAVFSSVVDKFWKLRKAPEQLSIDDLKSLIRLVPIWAKQNGSSFAQMSLEDETLHLYALRKATPPSNAIIVPYCHVRSLVSMSVEVFLDISWENQERGRVYIKTENEDHVTPFLKRCSGEDPNSFVNSRMNEVLDKYNHNQCRLSGGGDGSKCFVEEPMNTSNTKFLLWVLYKSLNTQNLVTLCLLNSITGFSIWLGNSTYNYRNGMFYDILGLVTKGMKVVKEASEYPDVRAVSITDCGLCL